MPAYKNQHFLCKRALRKFGHADGRSIDLFNIRTGAVVTGASVADQCSKPYFYMKGGDLESAFADIENKGIDVFERIEATGALPEKGTPEHDDLIRYISFQEGRTLGAAQEVQNLQEAAAKILLEESFKAKGDPDGLIKYLPDIKIKFNNLPLENVFRSTVASPLLSDLSLGLFNSSPNQEFVLGDDPVVLTNKLIVLDGAPLCGLASRGLIVLCPITPRLTLTLFDPEAYRVRTHPLSKEECIELNVMQAKSSYANFYFRDYDLISESCGAPQGSPPATGLNVQAITVGPKRGVIINHVKPSVALGAIICRRFIVKSAAKRNNFKIGNARVRNPGMANLVRSLKEPKDFAAFMRDEKIK